MNDQFIQQAKSNGPEGEKWLAKIPEIINQSEQKWGLKLDPPFNLTYNYVAPGVLADGRPVVLKIGFPGDPEFQTEIAALKIFNGEGSARLYEIDPQNNCILIERVNPGITLTNLDDDQAATRILANVIKKLHKPLPADHKFIPISQWRRAIPQYQQKYRGNGPLPQVLVDQAEKLFDQLISTSTEAVLVHGDLHQDNILSSDRAGWLAIDPKGIAAEPCYETAAMIRNPYQKLKDIPDLSDLLTHRILILSDLLKFDPKRIRDWGIAQSVLSAVWNLGEGAKTPEHAVRVAQTLNQLNF